MTVFTEPDRLMTYAWDDFDPRHPRHDPASARLYGDLFLRHFQHLDTVVGQFMDEWLDKATIIIVSDHGFAGVHKFFYPNVWLQQHGYLALNQAARPSALARAKGIARSLGVAHQAKKLAKRFFPDWGFTTGSRNADFVQAVDWSQTRAYWGGRQWPDHQLKGRQPQATVDPADYEALRDELMSQWRELREPASGDLVVEQIYRREDIYSGLDAQNSPDLRVVWHQAGAGAEADHAAGADARSDDGLALHRYQAGKLASSRGAGMAALAWRRGNRWGSTPRSSRSTTPREQLATYLHSMPPERFEALIGELLIQMGFDESSVRVTRRSGDGGIDVIGAYRALD